MAEDEKMLMNGVEVNLKNPGTAGLKDFLIINKAMSKMPKINREGKTEEEIVKELEESNVSILDYLNDKEMDSLTNLINLTIKKTFGDVTEEIDGWAMANSIALIKKILEMCSPKQKSNDEDRKEALVNKLKQDAQSTKE